jgi:glycosyltransferase involved in cell wall biosynthesis
LEFYAAGQMQAIAGLANSSVVGLCCQHFVHAMPELKSLGCKTVWSPAMTTAMIYANPLRESPPDVVHYQSRYQFNALYPLYREWGVKDQILIHGAFDKSLFPFRPLPHVRGEPFIVGRLARACRSKWPRWLWAVLHDVRQRGLDVRFLGMGWNRELEQYCGLPPQWAECLPENSLPAADFMARCHCLICPNGNDVENWPRVGLEAMSAGVPLLVDDKGGWQEMLAGSGQFCRSAADYALAIGWLAERERWREEFILAGLRRLDDIADPAVIGQQWREVFATL